MKRKHGHLKRADCRLRLFCRRLTGSQRILVTVTSFLLFTAACLYTIVSTLSAPGKGGGRQGMEHIRPLGLQPGKTTIHLNSNTYENGHPEVERAAGTRK